ncbi:hypothetical protein [Nosocomiicoccus massiliensis]|uniref:Uncharacterized protein n=1 Tax=Nosocomiicoccus massiliensis TaxID=1232430 RepID=A0AAF1BT81_9STAP|nr:hypothetical protein [Nosocomiicoccus massiliensis]WOS96682.1 hypothetical protein CJ229_002760 [Nosocomiicoccus massiliensis]
MFNEIDQTILKLFKEESGYSVSKQAGLSYQTVQDLRNGKSSLEKARYETIKSLYEYAKKQGYNIL